MSTGNQVKQKVPFGEAKAYDFEVEVALGQALVTYKSVDGIPVLKTTYNLETATIEAHGEVNENGFYQGEHQKFHSNGMLYLRGTLDESSKLVGSYIKLNKNGWFDGNFEGTGDSKLDKRTKGPFPFDGEVKRPKLAKSAEEITGLIKQGDVVGALNAIDQNMIDIGQAQKKSNDRKLKIVY